ncbi:hypothetical protein ACIGD1_11280 [Streptomyces sp. NPDC085612]|uniref:hypothetical protein n=1 Tax=Streptomyces sp. NPDC085612 TaxID=3365732 RepID=UPI0037D1049E
MTAPTSRAWVQAAARRLTTGTELLAAHIVRRVAAWLRDTWARTMAWLSDATGIAWAVRLCALLAAAWVLRKVGVSLAGTVARRIDQSAWLLWPALAVWIIAAWRVGHPDWKPRTAPEAAGEKPGPTAEQPPATPVPDRAGPSLDEVLDAARKLGTPHVHLAAITDHLGAPDGAVRQVLTAAGIPIGDVRMQGRGTSTGVKGADIPTAPSPSPEGAGAAVGAAQGANNSNNNVRVDRIGDGAQITVTKLDERRAYTV